MAESGHGVAAIPSSLLTDRHSLHLVAIICLAQPLRERLAIYWDRRRPFAHYASEFCEILVRYMRELTSLSRPTVTTPYKLTLEEG